MFKKGWLALSASVVCAMALAQPVFAADDAAKSNPESTVRQAVLGLAKVQIDSIKPAPIPGYYQVIASGQLVYVSADGKYMFTGNLIDLASKKDLGDMAWADFRKAELAKVPVADRIVLQRDGRMGARAPFKLFQRKATGFVRELPRLRTDQLGRTPSNASCRSRRTAGRVERSISRGFQ